MGFAENVFNKVRGTPSFKPASIDSFGNWAIEAGDVITVENDGVTESIPIFSADMSWDGSAQTTMSCTGNQKRDISRPVENLRHPTVCMAMPAKRQRSLRILSG